MFYKIHHSDPNSHARTGTIKTGHGEIKTPVFMPVGTLGNVKGVHFSTLIDDIKAQIILGNTYHLFLRPGTKIIGKAGGLHQFIGWNKPILADSGGYQVFSLSEIRKLKPEGVEFRSHIDGSKHIFTPENVIDTQRIFGNDIIMPLDECTPYPCTYDYAKKSMELTHEWLKRGLKHFQSTSSLYSHQQTLFPIVQGSVYSDLRRQSASFIADLDVDGIAIGGLSVGEPVEIMYEMIETVNEIIPLSKPRYLMGVGTPANLIEGIARGIDMFDCVMPTRNGRNGMLFTSKGIINIRNKKWENDFSPLDEDGSSFVDGQYSKAFLRHTFISGEMLGPVIASIHNLRFYVELMETARQQIENGTFSQWKNENLPLLQNRL